MVKTTASLHATQYMYTVQPGTAVLLTDYIFLVPKKIPHTGDIESLDRCKQKHRYHFFLLVKFFFVVEQNNSFKSVKKNCWGAWQFFLIFFLLFKKKLQLTKNVWRGRTNERSGAHHVTWGPMRGLINNGKLLCSPGTSFAPLGSDGAKPARHAHVDFSVKISQHSELFVKIAFFI